MIEERKSNYILSRDGLKLNCLISASEYPEAIVCILHGHGEHGGRYMEVVQSFNDQNIGCVVTDFRGHGLSEGRRGHINSMSQVLNDVEEVLKFTRSQYLDLPIFIFGHSFGGCVVLNYVLKKPVLELEGFIVSSPWLRLAFTPPKWKLKLASFTSVIIPMLTLPSGLDKMGLSHDNEVIDNYKNDPLVHDRVSARFFKEVENAGNDLLNSSGKLKIPGLVYHGNADQVIDFTATKSFVGLYEQLITFWELDNVYHEPHNDINKENLMTDILNWIKNKK